MWATDDRSSALRAALSDNVIIGAATSDDLAAVKLAVLAADLAAAHHCETRLALVQLRRAEAPHAGQEFAFRSLAVLESISLVALRTESSSACARFGDSMALAAQAGAMSAGVPIALKRLFDAGLEQVDHGLEIAERAVVKPGPERTILDLGACVMLCRHRLYRPAKGLLGEIAKRAAADSVDPRAEASVERIAHSVTSEIELQSARVKQHPVAEADDARNREVIDRRLGASEFHGRVGRHPRFGKRKLEPSGFAAYPPPRRPREVGVGLCTAICAGVFAASLWWPARHPLSGRLHEVREVPFGGRIASPDVRSAAIAGVTGDLDILLTDPINGVRSLDLSTLGVHGEGGPGTALDGTVRELAANADGTALAIFDSRVDGSACVSVRGLDGEWRPVIAPSELNVGGDELAGAIDGLPMPVLFRSKGTPRLLIYDSATRALRPAKLDDGAAPILGDFVAATADRTTTESSCALVLTSGEGGGVYRFGAAGPSSLLRVVALGLPEGLHTADAVAVGPGGDGEALLVDRKGRAWRSGTGHPSKWTLMRAGTQNLQLDRVDAAAITESGRRMWLVREGVAWTRALPTAGEPPADATGWMTCQLPIAEPIFADERLMLVESPGRSEVVVVRTAGAAAKPSGFVVRLTVASGAVALEDLLQRGERLVDADAWGRTVMLRTTAPGADGLRLHRIEVLDLGGKAVERVAEWRKPIRSWTDPSPADADRFDEPVLAFGANSRLAIALFRDGRFVRFDPLRDLLLTAAADVSGSVGKVPVRSDAVDAAIDAAAEPATAWTLGADGRIESFTLAASTDAPPRTLVDPGDVVPAGLVAQATHVIAAKNGAVVAAPGFLWRLDLADAANFWTDLSPTLAGSMRPAELSFAGVSEPVFAWPANAEAPARVFWQGSMRPVEGLAVSILEPGIRQPYYGRTQAGGTIRALEADGSSRVVLAQQQRGPAEVLEATIRPEFVDYLARGRLHSVSLDSGAWTDSRPIEGDHKLGVIYTPNGETVVVVPRSREGVSYAVPPGAGAETLAPLGQGAELRSISPIGGGVIGIDAAHDIRFLDALGKFDASLEDRMTPGVSLDVVDEVVRRSSTLYLRGRSDGRGMVVGYPMRHEPAFVYSANDITALELGSAEVFALEGSRVVALGPHDLDPKHVWQFKGREVALGHSENTDPPLVVDGSIVLLSRPAQKIVLQAGASVEGATPRFAAAYGSTITMFTPDGAWSRDASPLAPFRRVSGILSLPEFIRFGPDGGAPWVRVQGRWARLGEPLSSSANLGWTPRGRRVSVNRQAGSPEIEGVTPTGFGPLATPLGMPRAVERVGGTTALVVGDDGSVLFDAATHRSTDGGSLLRDIDIGARVVQRGQDHVRILRADKRIVEVRAGGARMMFEGARIDDYVHAPVTLAGTTDGLVVDAQKGPVRFLPPVKPGEEVEVAAVVPVDGGFLRVVARRVERFDAHSMQLTSVRGLEADELARCGRMVFAFDRVGKRVVTLTDETIADVLGWYPAQDCIALLRPSGVLSVLSERGVTQVRDAAEPLPGTIVGNLPSSAVAALRTGDDTYALYDLLAGKTVGQPIQGSELSVGPGAVYLTDRGGRRVLRCDARGGICESEVFEQVVLRADPAGVDIHAASRSSGNYRVLRLDPESLQPIGEPIFEASPRFPPENPAQTRAALVPLGKATLLVSVDRLGLHDGRTVAVAPNPLGTSSVKAMWYAGSVWLVTEDGEWTEAVRMVRGEPELALKPGVQNQDRSLDWLLPIPLSSRTYTDSAPFGGSIVDLATGWILAERPKALSAAEGLVVEFEGAAAPRRLASLRAAKETGLVEPLSLLRGELRYAGREGEARLGVPVAGQRLPIHGAVAVAPLTEDSCAWIDALGQLWTSGRGGKIPLPAAEKMEAFQVDDHGAVYAIAGAKRFQLTVGSRGVVSFEEVHVGARLYRDAAHLPERAGPFRWSTSGVRDGAAFEWEIGNGEGGWIALRSTSNGFDLLAWSKLVLFGDRPAIQTGSAVNPLFAPIRDHAVDWSQLTSRAAAVKPQSAEPLATTASFDGGLTLKFADGVFALHFGGRAFPYQLGKRRFASAVCSAATVADGRLIVATEDGDCLLAWTLGDADELVAPSRIEHPPGCRVQSLLPGDDADSFVAEFFDAEARETTFSSWRAGSWSSYEQPKFMKTPTARWSWDLGSNLVVGTDAALRLVAGQQPLLECDRVEFDPSNPKHAGESVRAFSDGTILYRGIGGQWFRLEPQQMPQPCGAPSPAPSRFDFEGLQIDRWSGKDLPVPACELVAGDTRLPIDLRVRDGLIEDLDGWDDDPIVPTGAASFEVASRSGKTMRTIEVADGVFHASLPRPVSAPKSYDQFRLRLQRGSFTLVAGRALRREGFDFGLPTRGGFEALDTSLAVPLGFAPDGTLVCGGPGRTVAFVPSRPLATIREIERGVSIECAEWEVLGGEPVFVALVAGGERRRVDVDAFTTQDLPALPERHLHCVRTEDGALDVVREEGNLVFARAGAEPLRLVLSIDDDEALFEHLRADRIEADAKGLMTHSAAWTARYAKNGEGLRLASVTPVDGAARARNRRDLLGGLVARRSPATGDCSLRLDNRDESPAWPLSSLLGPSRIFVDKDGGAIEAAALWSRRSGLDGLVLARWPDARGAVIATSAAHRHADEIVAGSANHELSADGPSVVGQVGAPVPERGQYQAWNAAGWSVSLPRYGGDCAIGYQGILLEVRDGALPMDMAVAPGGAAHALLIDRLGVQRVHAGGQVWSMHPEAHRGSILQAVPTALIGVSSGSDVRSCFSVVSSDGTRLFAPPALPDGVLEAVPAGEAAESWALGRQVAFRFGCDGMLRLSRVFAASDARHNLPPLPKAEACVHGRLAFDMPQDLILARRPGAAVADACVVMRTGWEWPDPAYPGGFRALAVVAPEPVEAEFGPFVRGDWFTGSDLATSASASVVGVAGHPIIWCSFGERLFLVGERSIAWLELGERWRGREVD